MKKYGEMSREELLSLKKELEQQYEEVKARVLPLICPAENRAWSSLTFQWE